MKLRLLLFLNTLTLLATLVVNYLYGSGRLNTKSVGEVSDQYPTLITPAGYAFSIWGLIYLLLIGFVGYQWYAYFNGRNEDSLNPAGGWFSLANIFNALWVFAWVHEALGLSVLIMLLLLFSLLRLVMRLRLEIWDAPLRIILFVWWPICIYTGWIVVATVTNIAVYLKSLGWTGAVLPPEIWAIIVIVLATLIYLFLTYTRNMREAALVGVWGLIAIAYQQWGDHDSVVITALLGAGILLLYAAYHSIKNKNTSPFIKLKNKEF